ncbi:unnamed protein product, partial [marine sediment metagenome]
IVDESINTPQITRIKALNQHVLRLETDYTNEISENIIEKFYDKIETRSRDIDSILVLDYGTGGLFKDIFIQNLLSRLKEYYRNIPILARPTISNYYLYEDVDLIKMNLQKALETFSIDCCNDTSIIIAGKRILNSSKCKNVLLNYLELDSYLFYKNFEKVEKIKPILQQQHNIDLISSYMVGDTLNDIQTGNAVRCKTVLVLTGYGKEEKKKIQSIIPDKIFKNLKEFVISI